MSHLVEQAVLKCVQATLYKLDKNVVSKRIQFSNLDINVSLKTLPYWYEVAGLPVG